MIRLVGNTEDICYQSFASDEIDQHPILNAANEDVKKSYRQNERITSLQTLDRLNTKIQCTKESIRKEQTTRDGKYPRKMYILIIKIDRLMYE